MNIFVIGSDRSEASDGLAQFAAEQGCSVHAATAENPVPGMDRADVGVVVFDDDAGRATRSLSEVRRRTRYLSVPLIAVTPRIGADDELLAAGAAAVCRAGSPGRDIVAAVRSRCDTRPVEPQIRADLLDPFASAVELTLKEMAGIEVTARTAYQKAGYRMFGDVSAVIALSGPMDGSMVISFPGATAAAIAAAVLAGVADEMDDDMINDCVGEVANVIAGQAKGVLAKTAYQFALSTPAIVSGAGHEIRHKAGMQCLVLAFGSAPGEFALQLCLKLDGHTRPEA